MCRPWSSGDTTSEQDIGDVFILASRHAVANTATVGLQNELGGGRVGNRWADSSIMAWAFGGGGPRGGHRCHRTGCGCAGLRVDVVRRMPRRPRASRWAVVPRSRQGTSSAVTFSGVTCSAAPLNCLSTRRPARCRLASRSTTQADCCSLPVASVVRATCTTPSRVLPSRRTNSGRQASRSSTMWWSPSRGWFTDSAQARLYFVPIGPDGVPVLPAF